MQPKKLHLQILKISAVFLFVTFSAEAFGQFPVLKREYRILKSADKHYSEKEFSKAIVKYRDYISRYGGNPDVWYKLAVSYQEFNQPERASVYFTKIIITHLL